jgi:DNA-binding GntR family transcriptional regulator
MLRQLESEMSARLLPACQHHDRFIEAIAEHDEQAVVDLVFEHCELSRRDMEMFIAPKRLKADALVPAPKSSSMESVS